MTREHLSRRTNWQAKAGLAGQGREETAKKILAVLLMNNNKYRVIERPMHLSKIYANKWGIVPDFAIQNTHTKKIAFFETKRQGTGGNAHERACRYFAPGVERAGAKVAGFNHPFFFIFMNGLIKDPKKKAEIMMWFDEEGYRDRYLLWDRDFKKLVDYFKNKVAKHLD